MEVSRPVKKVAVARDCYRDDSALIMEKVSKM